MKTAFQIAMVHANGSVRPLTAEYSGTVLEFRTREQAAAYAEGCFMAWRRKPAYHIVEVTYVETVTAG